jgi:NAD(P)-dependent dehydrogenase (short-subunit alcohol dehydrogenase family)
VATHDFSVVGKHVLITGGTGGIGGALAKAFLDHGANVMVADIAAPKAGTDSRIRYEQLDLRDDAAVEALAARVEKLDVVIHCAGRLALQDAVMRVRRGGWSTNDGENQRFLRTHADQGALFNVHERAPAGVRPNTW